MESGVALRLPPHSKTPFCSPPPSGARLCEPQRVARFRPLRVTDPRSVSLPIAQGFGESGRNGRASANRKHGAFSLIEILVTVGLLSFIILGLLLMFNQTQRAFRSSITQTDVLEAGRSVMDMLAREIEQSVPSQYPDMFVGGVRYRATNFFVEPSPLFNNPPLKLGLPGMPTAGPVIFERTNLVQRFFFLSKVNQDLVGTGYMVVPDDANACVGTLYRFSGTNLRSAPVTVSSSFLRAAQVALNDATSGRQVTNLSRIVDGVVHLRVRAFATNGSLIISRPSTNGFALTPNPIGPYTNVANTIVLGSSAWDPLQYACYFMNEAVPAYVEVEMAILEPQVLQRYRSIPLATAQRNYLSNHTAQVHVFRQRVPIQNVDFTAYP